MAERRAESHLALGPRKTRFGPAGNVVLAGANAVFLRALGVRGNIRSGCALCTMAALIVGRGYRWCIVVLNATQFPTFGVGKTVYVCGRAWPRSGRSSRRRPIGNLSRGKERHRRARRRVSRLFGPRASRADLRGEPQRRCRTASATESAEIADLALTRARRRWYPDDASGTPSADRSSGTPALADALSRGGLPWRTGAGTRNALQECRREISDT
jgi:hypothetical protein